MNYITLMGESIPIDQSVIDAAEQMPANSKNLIYLSDSGRLDRGLPQEFWGKWKRHARLRCRSKSTIPVVVFSAERCTRQRRHLFKVIEKSKRPMILLFDGGGKPPNGEICDAGGYMSLRIGYNVILFTFGANKMNHLQTVIFRYLVSHWDEVPYNALDWLEKRERIE